MNEAAPTQQVDRRVVPVWRIALLLGLTPAAFALLVLTTIFTVARAPAAPLFWVLTPVALIAFAAIVVIYPPARYRRLGYRVNEAGIVIRDGILWRSDAALPSVRIQHADVAQGPLQRRYGVATLKLYTAGSRFTLTELPGLDEHEARRLRDELLEHGAGDAV